MTVFASASIDRDANTRAITSNEAFKLESTWTFAAATTGAATSHTLFTVTGNVLVTVFGVVDTTLDSAGTPTIEVGVTGNTAALVAQGTAKNYADGDIYVDATDTRVGVGAVPAMQIINDGLDILLKITSSTLTAGVIDFYCLWSPLSSYANITVTTPA